MGVFGRMLLLLSLWHAPVPMVHAHAMSLSQVGERYDLAAHLLMHHRGGMVGARGNTHEISFCFPPVRDLPSRDVNMLGWWNRFLGNAGERAAARYLRRLGFTIVTRQFRNSFGEIDLIAIDGNWLVFVEVKTRRNELAGRPAEAVTPEKQRRLSRTAQAFIHQRRLHNYRSRFDVVAITWESQQRIPKIEHLRHAFSPGD